jgi:hypothetical protein
MFDILIVLATFAILAISPLIVAISSSPPSSPFSFTLTTLTHPLLNQVIHGGNRWKGTDKRCVIIFLVLSDGGDEAG